MPRPARPRLLGLIRFSVCGCAAASTSGCPDGVEGRGELDPRTATSPGKLRGGIPETRRQNHEISQMCICKHGTQGTL